MASEKLWAGRFAKETDETVNAFNSSIAFDKRMYSADIWGSIAHARMLAKCGIITEEDFKAINGGLIGIVDDVANKHLQFDETAEDIHMFIEAELTKRIGTAGKKLHTARSRNDQVATDIRLYLKWEANKIGGRLKNLIESLKEIAEQHINTIMPGYTHLQRAQPITFAHHLLAYVQMFIRDIGRLEDTVKRMSECPLGAGALAGTTYPIDRFFTAENLAFTRPTANSLDSVADRDFCVELASTITLIMVHLSRLSEEIILWASWEFKFIELDDAYATGSSIMPQKKNPDVAELIRGKTGRVIGDFVTLATMLKGLPLAYNKDMQEDKEAIFDAVDTVLLCLKTMTPMLRTMTVNKENMRNAAAKGFINATDCADYLVTKGLAFRDAYKITGEIVRYCMEYGKTLETLEIAEYKKHSEKFDNDVFSAVNLDNCVNRRNSYGGTSPEAIKTQLKEIEELIENNFQHKQ
jgi:argininosuccinate lyase